MWSDVQASISKNVKEFHEFAQDVNQKFPTISNFFFFSDAWSQ